MTIEKRRLEIDGISSTVVISDESEALLAALAAGSAIVGIWKPGNGQDLSMADYLVERLEDADEPFLEKVVRRAKGLPLQIAATDRLRIREFTLSDAAQVPAEPEDREEDRIFADSGMLEAYIRSQYGFYEYGIWALVDKQSGRLIGKAGVTGTKQRQFPLPEQSKCSQKEDQEEDPELVLQKDQACVRGSAPSEFGLELGYHVFQPYRNHGYGYEACLAIIRYAEAAFNPAFLYLKTDAANTASVSLAEKLGFMQLRPEEAEYNEGVLTLYRCAANY